MDEDYQQPVQFSKGINLRELMTSEAEFHIDLDFKKKINIENLLTADYSSSESEEDEDSDTQEAFKNIEQQTDKILLSCPEKLSFDEIASKMVECDVNGAVKLLAIEEGDGPLVPPDAEVSIHYAAYWENESIPFDCTLTMNHGAPLHVRLGVGKILPGLEIGLKMVKGPKARFNLLLQPEAAWGPRGVLPRIKVEPALFVVVLYEVRDMYAVARFNDLPREEQQKFNVTMKTVNSLHSQAKDLFTKKKYLKAIKNYQQSMNVLNISQPKDETERAEVKRLKIKAYINLAVCYYKINKPKYVIYMCENLDRIIDIETNCKALFYYGKGSEMLGKQEEAMKYYRKALKLEPKNKEIGKTLADLDNSMTRSAKVEKEMWQTAFDTGPVNKDEVNYVVDDDFQSGVRDMCEDLISRNDYTKFDLPSGLTNDEVTCIKTLVNKFKGLLVVEDGEGSKMKLSIIRK